MIISYRLIIKTAFFTSFILAIFFVVYYAVSFRVLLLVSAVGFGLVSGTLFIILMPPTYKQKGIKREPFLLKGADESDVWILVSEDSLYLPWYNAISKEIGPCRLINRITTVDTTPRLLVIPSGTELSKDGVDILSTWVSNGTSLLCECPDKTLSRLTGLNYIEEEYNCSNEQFLNTPVDLTCASAVIYNSSKSNSSPDTQESLFFFENKIGTGFVFTLGIRYGKWALGITQGSPNRPDGRFSKGIGWDMQGIQTPDLRTDSPDPYAFAPVLDVFDQTLFGHIRDRLKIPAWWYYPDARACAFVMTFDEDWFGRRINDFPMPKLPATWFVVDDSDMDIQAVDLIRRHGGTIQFHWNRFFIHLNKFGWHFCLRNASEQVDRISKETKNQPCFLPDTLLKMGL